MATCSGKSINQHAFCCSAVWMESTSKKLQARPYRSQQGTLHIVTVQQTRWRKICSTQDVLGFQVWLASLWWASLHPFMRLMPTTSECDSTPNAFRCNFYRTSASDPRILKGMVLWTRLLDLRPSKLQGSSIMPLALLNRCDSLMA